MVRFFIGSEIRSYLEVFTVENLNNTAVRMCGIKRVKFCKNEQNEFLNMSLNGITLLT